MKNLLYIFLVFGILFSSCEEETDDPFNPTSSFSCLIDGVQLNGATVTADIVADSNNPFYGYLDIIGSSDLKGDKLMNTVTIRIANFSSASPNNINSGLGVVWQGIDIYQTTGASPFIFEVIFTEISNKVSGTFSFEALNIDPNENTKVKVTEGSFSDVYY
jgi:hypothetical protein